MSEFDCPLQKLFDYMHQDHGLSLLQSDMHEIIRIVRGLDRWQSMETAPKDRVIKLWHADLECWLPNEWTGSWHFSEKKWSIHLPFKADDKCAIFIPEKPPTHWQPLLETPKQ